jgi:glycosyltransferase involved in cell wall biosynthesis
MISAQPLVSVLMTSYNREKYIEQAIESVLKSTYQNLELIITDDRSIDKTVDIAKDYAAKDKRVKVFVNEKNLGDYANRNKAASYASGKYLKYVDSDDCIYPWGIEMLVVMMEQFPEAGWGLCSLVQIPEKPYPFILSPLEAYRYHYFKVEIFNKAPLSSIIRKDAFEHTGGFKDLRMAGDFEMWHRLALNYPVVLMPDGMVWYREHAGQEIKHYRKFLFKYQEVIQTYMSHKDCPLDFDTKQQIRRKRIQAFGRAFIGSALRLRFANAIDNARLFFYNIQKPLK